MPDFLNDLSTYPILRIPLDWENPIGAEFELSQKINNYPGTIDEVVTYSEERPFICDLPFKLLSKEEEYNFIIHFVTHKGRWKKFWLPAPHDFFELDDDILSSQTFVVVKDREFRESHRGFERLWLKLFDGDWLTFKIVSVLAGPGAGQEKINLSIGIDRNISISEVEICSFFYLGRFDLDRMEMEAKTGEASMVNQKFVELVKEYP